MPPLKSGGRVKIILQMLTIFSFKQYDKVKLIFGQTFNLIKELMMALQLLIFAVTRGLYCQLFGRNQVKL